jgi:signal transduction histidine kinase
METRLALDYTSVFSVLSELIEIGIVVVNPAGEMDFASGRARTLLGCPDELSLESCHPPLQTAIQEIIAGQRGRSDMSLEKEVRVDVGGQEHHLLLDAHRIEESDCSGILILVRDADNLRKMALDLQMSAQFRNTRRLYQAVVHDLKQPITAVLVHLDLLRGLLRNDDEEGEEPPSPEMKSLRVIKSQLTDLNRTLTLLLEEIQPAETEERGFSLRDVVEDVARLVEPQAAQQDVSVTVLAGEHAARMTGSRQLVKQAILNLAVNALDAMPDGGDLALALDVNDGRANIRVQDTGTGIESEVLPHIFEMHYTTKASGTGAGLYVARDVIRRHEGTIDVETVKGKGSCFRVSLAVSESGL